MLPSYTTTPKVPSSSFGQVSPSPRIRPPEICLVSSLPLHKPMTFSVYMRLLRSQTPASTSTGLMIGWLRRVQITSNREKRGGSITRSCPDNSTPMIRWETKLSSSKLTTSTALQPTSPTTPLQNSSTTKRTILTHSSGVSPPISPSLHSQSPSPFSSSYSFFRSSHDTTLSLT